MEKVCKVCLEMKPLSDFYIHPKMADGHLGKCKECQKASTARARAANPDYYRKYDRERGKLPHRIAKAIEQTKKWRDADVFVVAHESGRGYYDQGGNACETEFDPEQHAEYKDMRGNPHVPPGAPYENKRSLLLGAMNV